MPQEKITSGYILIPNRGRISLGGTAATKFLQGLISNDLDKLLTKPSLHACLLSAQGKYLHDFIITRTSGGYELDCEGGERTLDLAKRLTMYKLRADVTVDAAPQATVYAVFGGDQGIPDPRHGDLGARISQKPSLPELPFALWDDRRIRLGIADGSRDAEIGKSTLEELNMVPTAVSFEKGCYVGQELTARMEHRGLAKRHLVPLSFAGTLPSPGTDIIIAGHVIGSMRSACGQIGLALLRDDSLQLLKDQNEQSPFHLLG